MLYSLPLNQSNYIEASPYQLLLFTEHKVQRYSPPQRFIERNESPVFVDILRGLAAVAHRNFYNEVEHSNLCQITFALIDIDFVLINMPP